MQCIYAVSYTHRDVYKRQAQQAAGLAGVRGEDGGQARHGEQFPMFGKYVEGVRVQNEAGGLSIRGGEQRFQHLRGAAAGKAGAGDDPLSIAQFPKAIRRLRRERAVPFRQGDACLLYTSSCV